MKIEIKQLPKSEIEMTITLAPEEVGSDIEAAAKRISASVKIPGFRPGHASYEMVKSRVGEMKIWEEAMETIIRRTYSQALKENKITTVGQPYFSVLNLAPGNPIIYKVKTTVLPKVVKLAPYKSLKIQKKNVVISSEDVSLSIGQMAKMQTREHEVDRPATPADKVVVDMNMYLDNIPLDGGQAKGHGIFLGENYYVPGLNEKLVGIKKGETREFELEFPKEHFQKNIAGKKVGFKVTASSVLQLEHPTQNDSFAQSLGAKSMDDLRALIRKNLEEEAELKEIQRQDIQILERIVADSIFEDIPDILVNAEVERMLHELENSITAQGLEWDKYLEGIKKTVPQLKLDFAPRALFRVKTALIVRLIADNEKIEPDDKEVSAEIARALNQYAHDAEAQKIIRSEEYAEEARSISRNRKTLELLRKLNIK